jgi:hypothetical protein
VELESKVGQLSIISSAIKEVAETDEGGRKRRPGRRRGTR